MGKKIASIILTVLATAAAFISVIGFSALNEYVNNMDTAGEAIALIFVILTIGVVYFGGMIIGGVFSLVTIGLSISGIRNNKENNELIDTPKKPIAFITCLILNSLYVIWYVVSIIIIKLPN